jgi:hypothetical protein
VFFFGVKGAKLKMIVAAVLNVFTNDIPVSIDSSTDYVYD